jgi:hypothetical protein
MEKVYGAFMHDLWISTPCHSTAVPSCVMEGTRLTLQVCLCPRSLHRLRRKLTGCEIETVVFINLVDAYSEFTSL